MIKLVHISSRFIINEFWVFCPARIGIPPHCAAPILTIPNTTDPFFLEVDASDVGLGAALFQRQNNVKRVVAYTSRVLSPEERSRGISYREGLACVFGMEKFRCFLDQVHFTLVTDHMPLTSITRDKDRFGVMTRLALRLQMFDYSVIYKSGAANVIPDYLSRTAQQTAMDSFNQVEGIASTDNGFASEEVHRPVISASRDPEGNGKGQKVWGLEYAPAAASIRLEKEQILERTVQGSDVGAIVLPVSHVDTMTARNHGGKKSHGRQSGDGAFEFPECQTDSVSELEQCVLVEEGKQSVQCAASNKLCLLGISAKLPPSKVKNKRQTEDEALADIPITFKVDVPTLIDQQRNDPEIDGLCSELENPQDRKLNSRQRKRIRARFRLLSGVLFHSRPAGLRLYVPTELRKDIMRSCHDNPLASHFGIDRTIYKVALKYYWKGMHSQIRAWVRTCEKCQRYKSECRPPRGLQMSTSHDACWADVYTDHFGPLPRSKKGNRYLLVFVCAFSRACELVPVRNASAATAAKALVDHVYTRYGAPVRLIMDAGPAFKADLFRQTCQLLGIKHQHTAAYYGPSNRSERVLRDLRRILGIYYDSSHTSWDEHLSLVRFALNSAVSTSVGFSPFYIQFGAHPREASDLYASPPVAGGQPESVDLDAYVVGLKKALKEIGIL